MKTLWELSGFFFANGFREEREEREEMEESVEET